MNAGLVSAAYTNSDNLPSTGTTLYYLNSTTDTLQRAINANNGPVVEVGALGAGVTFSSNVGFDISGTGVAYAAVNLDGGIDSTFHTINLTTGEQTTLGTFDIETVGTVRGIAAQPLIAPEPGTLALVGVGLVAARFRRLRRRNG